MIDVRLDDDYEAMIQALMEYHKERTAVGLVRTLIRDDLRRCGLWPIGEPVVSLPLGLTGDETHR